MVILLAKTGACWPTRAGKKAISAAPRYLFLFFYFSFLSNEQFMVNRFY